MGRLPSAKLIDEFYLEDEYTVSIDGFNYRFSGGTTESNIMAAIEEHIKQDREFTNWLTVIYPDRDTEKFFTPAILCGFNYMSIKEFMSAAIDGVREESSEGYDDC